MNWITAYEFHKLQKVGQVILFDFKDDLFFVDECLTNNGDEITSIDEVEYVMFSGWWSDCNKNRPFFENWIDFNVKPSAKCAVVFDEEKACIDFFIGAKKKAKRTISKKSRFELLKKYNFSCTLCGSTAIDGAKLEIDHIIPISKGGSNEDSNLTVLCKKCNVGKKDKIISRQINSEYQ